MRTLRLVSGALYYMFVLFILTSVAGFIALGIALSRNM